LRLGGGNQFGYLYGSFAHFGDGIELGYGGYYDSAGNWQGKTDWYRGTLRVGYGELSFYYGYGHTSIEVFRIDGDPPTFTYNTTTD